MADARFAHAICNAGSETLLIAEVARLAPGVVPAYRRKGLLTFRLTPEREGLGEVIFARVHGASLGLARDAAEVLARAERIEPPLRLQVYGRDASLAGPEPEWTARAESLERELRARRAFLPGAAAEPGDRVLEVIVAGDEPLVVGTRTQGDGWRVPGGRPDLALPADAPSRAYLKLEEALAWSRLGLEPGETAVELGSAPGGAAHALVERGVHVIGVDPAAMDPRVLAKKGPSGARVTHLPLEIGALRRQHVPAGASLLLCDVNLAPPVALRAVVSAASWMGRSLRAAILTLKLNDQKMVEAIPELLARVGALGLAVSATQLPSNRREFCVVARAR